MVQNIQNFKKQMNGWFGPPGEAIKNITELSNSLVSIDQAKLKEVRSLMGALGNFPVDVEQLRLVVELVKMLCAVDIENVKEFRQLILNLIQLVKLLPKDMKDLPISDILHQVKQS